MHTKVCTLNCGHKRRIQAKKTKGKNYKRTKGQMGKNTIGLKGKRQKGDGQKDEKIKGQRDKKIAGQGTIKRKVSKYKKYFIDLLQPSLF